MDAPAHDAGRLHLEMTGLLRWTFVVPVIAAEHERGTSGPALRLVYEVQHQLFGVLLGEHLGQLLLAIWTAGVSWALGTTGPLGRMRAVIGVASAGLFVFGLGDGLRTVGLSLPPIVATAPLVAFTLWCAWSVLLGLAVARHGSREPLRT